MSSSHFARFLEPQFVYVYEDALRVEFLTEEAALRHFRSERQRSRRVFVAALPVFARFLAGAEAQGIALGDLRLRGLSAQALEGPACATAADVLGAADAPYPRLVKLDLSAPGPAAYDRNHLNILLEQAPSPQQAAWLLTQAADLRYTTLAQREAAIEALGGAEVPWVAGFAAVRVGHCVALSVGRTDDVRADNVAHFQAQAEALATELFPQVEQAFASEARLSALFTGDARALVPIRSKLGEARTAEDLAALFNPHGPLLDARGRRSAVQVGGLRVTLLYAVQGAGGARPADPQPTRELEAFLARIGAGEAGP